MLVGAGSAWASTETAFSQNFEGTSTDPADYDFALSYGNGSNAELVKFSVADGVLSCAAGPYSSSSDGARTGTATATFNPISGSEAVTVSYTWALGNATGNASGSYTETYIGNQSGKVLDIKFMGSQDDGTLQVNGTTVLSGNSVIRNTTYTVTAVINLTSKKIESLQMTNSNANFNYSATNLNFINNVTTIDRFAFENSERQNWTNTSTIDNLSITYFYEDPESTGGTGAFEAKNRITNNGDGTFTTASNAGNEYALALADLSGKDNYSIASKVTLEFDVQITGRLMIGIGDKSVRGTNANGSNKATYNIDGLVMRYGTTEGTYVRVNGGTNNSDALDVLSHVKFVLDRNAGTYSYLITKKETGATLFSANNVETTVLTADLIEAYTWNKDQTFTLDNLTYSIEYLSENPLFFVSNNGIEDLSAENETANMIELEFNEPTLYGVPAWAEGKIVYTSSNPKLAVFDDETKYTGNVRFINTGLVSITASLGSFSASYNVVVSAGDAAYLAEGNRYELVERKLTDEEQAELTTDKERELAKGGKLQERVVTSVPFITMEFGNQDHMQNDYVDVTIARYESRGDGKDIVATTLASNGWRDAYFTTDGDNQKPYEGTYYTFMPTANGTLKVEGYITTSNTEAGNGQGTAILVDATDGYAQVAAITVDHRAAANITADLTKDHVYYLFGVNPNYDSNLSVWSTYELAAFEFESNFKFEVPAVTLAHGETSYSGQTVKGFSGGASDYTVVLKGGVTAATVSDANGNVTGIEGENGAVIVIASDDENTIHYVITVPSSYENDVVWDFWKDQTGLDIADYKGDGNAESSKWITNYKVRTYVNRELTYLNNCVLTTNRSVQGDNAYYIGATAGLVFNAAAKNFGANATNVGTYESTEGKESYEIDVILREMLNADVNNINVNDNAKVTSYYNSTMTIPQVPSGKIIRVYWQCYNSNRGQYILPSLSNENCYLTDMEGKTITGAFGIGKVVEYVSQGETKYRGETIFTIQTDNDNVEYSDITFKINDEGWTNFIKIEVLDEVGTNMVLSNQSGNSMRATNSAIVYDGKTTKTVAYKAGPNYANNAMMLNPVYTLDTTNGNLDATLTATAGQNDSWYDLTLTVNGGCGTAMIIQKMYDASNTYVLDEVITYIPVGILSTDMEFPKTWDFTSASLGKSSQYESMADDANYGSWNEGKVMTSFGTTSANSVNVNVNQSDNGAARATLLFASGSELTSGTTTIEEAKGVGFGWVNQLCAAGTPNNVTLTDDGVQMSRRGGGNPTVTIPSVPANSRIYVKSTLEPTLVRLNGTNISAPENSDAVTGVYRYDITAAGTVEIRWAGGVTVQKIAVTDILKDVNHLGFASESRNHNIDHSLNTELTNHNVKAYAVTADDVVTDGYNAVKVNLTEANQFTVVPEGQGVVLWNGQTEVGTTTFQQPLFYPAMHIDPTEADEALAAEGKNMMVGMPEGGNVGAYDGDFANYIMAYRHYTYDSNTGSNGDIVTENFEAFYPVMNAGSIGTNKAYLHIDKNLLPTPIWEGGSTGGSGVKNMIYIGYIPEGEGQNDEPTGINLVDNNGVESMENTVWYNLSGQQLNGRPATSGVYIVNGKKVMIK